MRSKSIACLLLCGVTLLAASPSKVFAQLGGPPADVPGSVSQGGAPAESKPRLKELFDEGMAQKQAGTMSEADLRRLEGKRLFPQSAPKASSGLSKRDAALLIVAMVVIVGVAIVVVHNGPENPPPLCADAPGTLDCVP